MKQTEFTQPLTPIPAGGRTDGVCYCIEGNVVDRVSSKNGKGWCEGVSPTLNTQDKHAVCFAWANSGSADLSVGEKSPTVKAARNGEPAVVVALEGNGARPSHLGDGYSAGGKSFTLNTIERHAVCYAVDCRNLYLNDEISGTIQAKNEGGFSLNFVNPVLMKNEG